MTESEFNFNNPTAVKGRNFAVIFSKFFNADIRTVSQFGFRYANKIARISKSLDLQQILQYALFAYTAFFRNSFSVVKKDIETFKKIGINFKS